MSNHDRSLAPTLRIQHGLLEPTILRRHPNGLLGVIGLVHVIAPHFGTDHQVGHGVGVGLIAAAQLDVAWHLQIGYKLRKYCIDYFKD